MLRIAVCDDNELFLKQEEQYLQKCLKDLHTAAEVIVFDQWRQLLNTLVMGEQYDLFLLDVEMPGLDGLELGKKIREYIPRPVLIYLSSHSEYALPAFEVEAFRFVAKSSLKEKLPGALEAAVQKIEVSKNTFVPVTTYGNTQRVFVDDIIYVQRVQRKLEIITLQQGVIADSRSLKELYTLISDIRFIYIDKSCFLNIDYLRKIDGSEAHLMDGTRLAVSRKQLPLLKELIRKIWGNS